MSGNHRAQESSKARIAVASGLTAGALLLAPLAAAIATPGVAHAGPAGGGSGNPGGPGAPGGAGEPGGPNDPGGPIGGTPTVHKNIIRLPGLKIEIKDTIGDHKLPKLKIVPFPGLNRILHPPTTGGNTGGCTHVGPPGGGPTGPGGGGPGNPGGPGAPGCTPGV